MSKDDYGVTAALKRSIGDPLRNGGVSILVIDAVPVEFFPLMTMRLFWNGKGISPPSTYDCYEGVHGCEGISKGWILVL